MLLHVPCRGEKTIAELLMKYNEANPGITDENFPCKDFGSREIEVIFPPLPSSGSSTTTTTDVLGAFKQFGVRSLDAAETLALGIQMTDVPLIGLGQTWVGKYSIHIVTARNLRANLTGLYGNWGKVAKFPATKIGSEVIHTLSVVRATGT